MKKHIIGLIVFGLVVSTAVLVKSFLFVKPEVNYIERTKNSCWRMKRVNADFISAPVSQSNKSVIEQAALDLSSRKMNWRMQVNAKDTIIALHFFTVNESGTNYIATEIAPSGFMDKSSDNAGNLEFTSSYLWLDNLNAPQNLYVIPEAISLSDYRAKNFNVNFDKEKATSILIYASGKK